MSEKLDLLENQAKEGLKLSSNYSTQPLPLHLQQEGQAIRRFYDQSLRLLYIHNKGLHE